MDHLYWKTDYWERRSEWWSQMGVQIGDDGLQGRQVSPACPAGRLLISLQVFSSECVVFPHTWLNLFVGYTMGFGMTGMTGQIQALLKTIQNVSGNQFRTVCYPAYQHFNTTCEDVHDHPDSRLSKQWKFTTILNVFWVFLSWSVIRSYIVPFLSVAGSKTKRSIAMRQQRSWIHHDSHRQQQR